MIDVGNLSDANNECYLDGYVEIRESDFYPPSDDRLHTFGIDDIDGEESYDDYVKWFWEEYEDEIYDMILVS